jgi:hypothetical protein
MQGLEGNIGMGKMARGFQIWRKRFKLGRRDKFAIDHMQDILT